MYKIMVAFMVAFTQRKIEKVAALTCFSFSCQIPFWRIWWSQKGPWMFKVELISFSTNAAGKLDILGHDGDPLCMYGT